MLGARPSLSSSTDIEEPGFFFVFGLLGSRIIKTKGREEEREEDNQYDIDKSNYDYQGKRMGSNRQGCLYGDNLSAIFLIDQWLEFHH